MTYVTGASGFLGKHLVNRLFGDCVCVPHDQIRKAHWKQANRVFFLSAYGNMAHHQDINKIVKANVSDLVFVLSKIDWKKIESFVFISTSSVKRRVQTAYSRTKKSAEEILLSYIEKYDAPITIIRPMSITGVGEQKEHLIPRLIDSCFNKTPMPFVGHPTHDFIDVEDMVDGIMNLCCNQAKGIYELGNGIPYTNNQVLAIVEMMTGEKANIFNVDSMRSYDDEHWVSENFKSRSYGWFPIKSLKLSITEMVNDFRSSKAN